MSEKHVPSEETARECFLDGAAGEFLPEDWAAFLAHVKRDAAREALDGLIEDAEIDVRLGIEGGDNLRVQDAEAAIDAAQIYRDTECPEETP